MAEIPIHELCIYSPNHRLYTIDFFGRTIYTTVTSDPAVADRWVTKTLSYYDRAFNRLVARFGVQWDFMNPKTMSLLSPAATLQICVGQRCLIYQLACAPYVPGILREFLVSERVTLVGLWNKFDRRRLQESNHRVEINRLINLALAAKRSNGENFTEFCMEEIVEYWIGRQGVGLIYWVSMSTWAAPFLSNTQVLQACVKAYVSYFIGIMISAWEIEN